MGNGKRKCKSCGDYVREFIVTPKGVFCSFEAASRWGYANKSKGKKIKENNNFHPNLNLKPLTTNLQQLIYLPSLP